MKHLKHVSETLVKTCEKHLKPTATHTQHPNKTIYMKHMQQLDKHTCNIRQKKQMKHSVTDACNIRVQTIANIRNTPIYFCNIRMKHLQ
jgi:hypothetical protein